VTNINSRASAEKPWKKKQKLEISLFSLLIILFCKKQKLIWDNFNSLSHSLHIRMASLQKHREKFNTSFFFKLLNKYLEKQMKKKKKI